MLIVDRKNLKKEMSFILYDTILYGTNVLGYGDVPLIKTIWVKLNIVALDFWLEGHEIKAQHHQDAPVGPLSKALDHQLSCAN